LRRITCFYVVNMAQNPKKPQQPSPQPQMTRRALSRHQREVRRQRLVVTITSVAVGLALVAVLAGVLYDRVWVPSRPIARVGGVSLSRGDYWSERRNDIARRMSQSIQLLALFGNQFGSQFEGQIPQLDADVATIRTAPVDDAAVDGWTQRQLIVQNAALEYNVQANDGEIAQRLVSDLSRAFPEPSPPPTSTATLTPTAGVSSTTALPLAGTEAPTAASTAAATNTAATGVPEATSAPTFGPTSTPAPTEVPTATPLPDVATQQADAILGRLYDAYQQEILRLSPDTLQPLKAQLTLDDFKSALHDQYLQQVVTEKVEEQLIPEAGFALSTDPSSIDVSQILITVTATLSDTQEQQDAAFAARRPEAEAILQQLRGGADFATVAKEKSEDYATRDGGGKLPGFDKTGKTSDGQQMDPAIVQAAQGLQEGQISDLVRTPFGWHIIKLDKITVPSKEDQLREARTKKFDEWIAAKRAVADIQRYPPVTPTPTTEPTATPAVLPTVQLAATPTPTEVPTDTATLSGTTTLPATPPTALAAPTVQSTPTAPAIPTGETAPTALPPPTTATPKP
jgi:hypothetical protein